jgi:uncharacterized membrane protein YqaE (UPF0057 family)
MRYLLALLCPPLAILLCGRPFLALFSIILLLGYFPAALLAMLVVSSTLADRRSRDQVAAIREQTKHLTRAIKGQPAPVVITNVAVVVSGHGAARPAGIPTPAPAALPTDAEPALPPGARIARLSGLFVHSMTSAKSAGIKAYQDLPEWAQPITWGLSAGSVVSVALACFIVLRR